MIKNRSTKKLLIKMVPILSPVELQIYFPSKGCKYFQFLSFVFYLSRGHVLNIMLEVKTVSVQFRLE